MDIDEHKYQQFKEDFWIWFDSLPYHKKKTFWNYKYDISETNFFFTKWEQK